MHPQHFEDGAKNEDRGYVLRTCPSLHACNENIGPSQAEQLLRVTSGIAAELIKAHDANQTVSLNELRAKMSKKYGYGGVPRLVDIISAIPDDYKKALLPKLKARPIRTASGVRTVVATLRYPLIRPADRRGCRNVQATSVSAHCYDREYMRVRNAVTAERQPTDIGPSDIVLEDQTPILTIAPKVTPDTNQPACELFVRGMTLTSKHEDVWSS